MTKHTPGPWETREHSDGSHWFVDYQQGGEGYTLVDELSEGDARLIAAAPELLEACYQALAAMRDLAEQAGDVPEWNTGGDAYEACNAIRAAIARAEGKVP